MVSSTSWILDNISSWGCRRKQYLPRASVKGHHHLNREKKGEDINMFVVHVAMNQLCSHCNAGALILYVLIVFRNWCSFRFKRSILYQTDIDKILVIFYEINDYMEINVVSCLFTGQDLRQVNLSAEYVYYHETPKHASNELSFRVSTKFKYWHNEETLTVLVIYKMIFFFKILILCKITEIQW